MKKLRTTLFVCLTALAVLTAFGCKQEGDFSKPSKDWKYQTDLNEPESEGTIQIVVDKGGPVEWAVIVDENNKVIRNDSEKTNVDGNSLAKGSVAEGRAIQFTKLDTGKKYTIYVYQPGAEVKVGDKKGTAKDLNRDLRGTVELKAKKGVSVKISNYGENVPQAGLVKITNNEDKGTWSGNYGITSIKAVEQDKETKKWVEVSGYTVTAPNNEYLISEKGAANSDGTFLFPAGTYHIAVKQPDRIGVNDDTKVLDHLKNNWFDASGKPKRDPMFPGYVEGATAEQSIETYKKYQREAYWISSDTQTIGAHTGTATLNTSSLTGYLDGSELATGRYAAPAVYEIVEAPAGER